MNYLKVTQTSAVCPKCKQKLHASDIPTYPFVCNNCDENFYAIEARHYYAEKFNIFIPLQKSAKDLVYAIKPIAEKYDGKCSKWCENSEGVYITFQSRCYAIDITDLCNEISRIPYVQKGMTLYERANINDQDIIIEEKLHVISPNMIPHKNETYDLYLTSKQTKSYKKLSDIGISLFDTPDCKQ